MLRTMLSGLAALVLAATTGLAQTVVPPVVPPAGTSRLPVATFGSGCFWCTESDFDKVPGIISTISGYMGGKTEKPTYEQVSSGRSGHVEVVQVTYDPDKVSYETLLDKYWHNVDPFDANGQFCDKGSQYRPVIFTHTPLQQTAAEASREATAKKLAERIKQPVAVKIEPAAAFTPAEEYHQDFYKKNAAHYSRYRTGCGRDARLEQIWGKPATH